MPKIKRALISVSDKKGLVEFAKGLAAFDVEILSTGGTAKTLRDAGIKVKDVSEHTGFPEMLGGRLKTLHPKVHGGLLARRDNEQDMKDIEAHGIGLIDMVVVNLYPFEATISKPDVTFQDAIENIDIGGPTMLRSSAKNFVSVVVVVDPGDYDRVLKEMESLNGDVGYKTRVELAKKVFRHTSRYDTLIGDYLAGVTEEPEGVPEFITKTYRLGRALRYGENPHQKAGIYFERTDGLSLANASIIQGKEMSFNNYHDTHVAISLVAEFDATACAIVKHANPCGCAVGANAADAYVKAARTDPVSAFGGVIAFNTEVDATAAREIVKLFVEVVIAKGYADDARAVFAEKPNIRLLEMPDIKAPLRGCDMTRIAGGLLLQEWDSRKLEVGAIKVVSKRQPTQEELEGLIFAEKVCKHVTSNAIVYAQRDRTLGIGIGQTSRISATKNGAINALESLKGAVVGSDGFFPFRDCVDAIYKVGVTAVIQPGGSVNDEEVIAAADEHNMAMLFTGVRHFKH